MLGCNVSVVGEEDKDSEAGDSMALLERLEKSGAAAKEDGGELLSAVEDDMKPNALKAEKRLLLEKPAPKLVRRGGCDSNAFVTGWVLFSELALLPLLLVEEKKN